MMHIPGFPSSGIPDLRDGIEFKASPFRSADDPDMTPPSL